MKRTIRYCIAALLLLGAVCCSRRPLGQFHEGISERNIFDLTHITHDTLGGTQQFDIDKDGNLYYAAIMLPSMSYVTITKLPPRPEGFSTETYGSMDLYYCGHPTGMSVEDADDGTYVWIGDYAEKRAPRSYWGAQAIARVKFENGKALYPEDPSIEWFFVDHIGDVNVSLDKEHDLLGVSAHLPGRGDHSRSIRVYRLSEALTLPLDTIVLNTHRRGGDGAPEAEEYELTPSILAHDLRKLTPLADFGTTNKGKTWQDVCYYAWQGFEVYGDHVLFIEGTGGRDPYGGKAALTVYDYEGNVLSRRFVKLPEDRDALDRFEIARDGHAEIESVKVRNGRLYLEFHSGNARREKGVVTSVFQFDLPQELSL